MWSKFTFLFALVVVASANKQLWEEFKVKHGKSYETELEHQLRYTIFAKNLETIKEHNAKYEQGLVSWYLAPTQFADHTFEEFKRLMTLQSNYTRPQGNKIHVPVSEIPKSIDWRTKGAVTAVKNQGGCGSCWSFSATGTLEGQYAIKNGKLVSLSEQNLMDCCTKEAGDYDTDACNGGVVQDALQFVADHGITTEDDYPYETRQGSCRKVQNVFQVKGYTDILRDDENDLKNAVGSIGPVSVAVNSSPLFLYGGGIFDDYCSPDLDHGVLAVGYGSENGKDYWIIKNSWGTQFGEDGYYRMAIGQNLCGVATQACYPNV